MLTPEQILEARKKLGIPGGGIVPSSIEAPKRTARQIADEQDAEILKNKEARSAESTSALFPAKSEDTSAKAGLKAVGNLPSSVYNVTKGLVQAVSHPIDTATGIVRATKGLGESLGRSLIEKTKFGDIKTPSGATLKENLLKLQPDINEQTYNAIVDSLHERYGTLENAQLTATNDPFGFGADVMAVLSGGAGLARKIAPEATSAISKVTKPLGDVNTAIREKAGGILEKSAQKDIEKVLAPTKESTKAQTTQILPELTKRRKIAFTRKGLSEKYANEMEKSGQAIDEAWKALPTDSQETVKPVIDALESSKEKFVVDGVVVEPGSWKAADDLQQIILDVSKGGETIPSESLRKVRQIWDETIAKSKGFTRDLSEQDKLAIKKEATDAIRGVISDAHPEIGKLNQEYTLWKKATNVLDETIKRKTGQALPLGTKILTGSGLAAGTASAGLKGAALGAGTIAAISLAFKSPLWKTLSAAAKNKLAQSIYEAKPTEIKTILLPIIGSQGVKLLDEED